MGSDTTTRGASLLPCPFCGSEPSHDKTMDESLWSHAIVPWRRVWCRQCEIGTAYVCEGGETNEVDQWNRRAQAPAQQGPSVAEFALQALVAAGHVTQEQVDAAMVLPGAPAVAPPPPAALAPERVREIVMEAGYDLNTPDPERAAFINGLRHGEAAHGIKGDA